MTTKTNQSNGAKMQIRALEAVPLCQIVLLINLATSFDAKKEHKILLQSRKSALSE